MSIDLFTPRSRSMVTRDLSTFSCSSSEASSRLAARLECSEYKRSRTKQRPNNSSRNQCQRRDSKGSRENNTVPSTRETRTKSEEEGVTSVWEVYRQNPYYHSDRTADDKPNKKEQRNTWYGMPSSSEPSQRRPQSVHIGSSDYSNLEYQPWSPGKQRQGNPLDHNVNQDSFEEKNKTQTSHYSNNHSLNMYTDTKEIQGDYSLSKKGMYLSTSLSSSFSSYVGSSDEKGDSQGIYSAYDVASRSPYEPMLNQRYSQSSHSSSNASWHQHQSPSLNYNMRDVPPLLDTPASKSHQGSNSKSQKSVSYQSEFREEFQVIQEASPPVIPPKPKKYSSRYTIQLLSSTKEPSTNKNDPIKGMDQHDNKGPSVREMAKKFTPTSVRHISSEYNNPEDDLNRVKTDDWVKSVSLSLQESSPSFEKNFSEMSSPPKSLNTEDKNWGVVMRQKDKLSNKPPEELAAHRLSLQELIQLHEEQIAIQAQSAKTIPTYAYTKRSPPTALSPLQNWSDFDSKGTKTTVQQESPKGQLAKPEFKSENVPESYKTPNSTVQKELSDYEVRDIVVSQSSPFKVIELTDNAVDTPKGRLSRLKRHRTIGIVGYRHQIDRTSGEKIETKLKRHTTVGIVSDFTDSSVEGLSKSQELPTKQEGHSLYPSGNTDVNHGDVTPSISTRLGDKTKPFPVKIFDIESNLEQPESQTLEVNESHQTEQFTTEVAEQVISVTSAECWYSGVSKDKDFLEFQKVDKYTIATPDSTDKEDGLLSSSTVEPQKDIGLSVSSNTEKNSSTLQETPSRNSHSPVVELRSERKGNPTAYYKNAVTSHSHLKKSPLDTPKKLSPGNLHNFGITKTHSIPVAEVSPVSHSLGSQEILETKTTQVVSPPPLPPSAHEMYETRLAMWDLLPRQGRSPGDLSEPLSNKGRFSFGHYSKDSSHQSKDLPTLKFVPPTFEDTTCKNIKGSTFSLNFQRLNKTEEYYHGVIEKLTAENHQLKEKNESEKREFRRMYEEQKKVANAYQKLEDRYRRRVHELQDALASCTCQGSLMENNLKSSHLNHRNEKESHTSKLQSSKTGMRMFEELEEWLSEQSKNSKASKANATSRDSLISSSSDLTGTGWDEHCDLYGGDIDEVNGTHV